MKKLRELIYDIIHRSENKNKELKGEIYNNTLYTNNYINIIHDCCKISHNGDINKSYEEKRKFISNILGYGHESILEHGYAIQGYILEDTYTKDLLELLNCNHYLFTKVKIKDTDVFSTFVWATGGDGYINCSVSITYRLNRLFENLPRRSALYLFVSVQLFCYPPVAKRFI